MKEEIVEILKKLLEFKTVKGEEEEFLKLFDYVKNLESNLVIEEYNFEGKRGMVVSNCMGNSFDIVFCTHVDVVPAESYDIVDDDEAIRGRGTIDMKGSVAVCLALLKYLQTSKRVGLFITTDEEIDGYVAKRLVDMYDVDLAIVPDGGADFDLINEEKGLLQVRVKVKGKRAHSSQPWNGENAIVKLMNIYEKLIEKYPLPKNGNDYVTSISIVGIEGGIGNNLVPDEAEMVLDIRHIDDDRKDKIIKDIKQIDRDIVIEVILDGNVFKSDIKHKKIERYIKVCEKILGRKVRIRGCESTSDAIYFSDLHIPTIIMNPKGDFAHGSLEYVEKDSLYDLYLIYKEYIEGDGLDV